MPTTARAPIVERALAARIAASRGVALARLGLRFDRVVQRVAAELRAHVDGVAPAGALILVTLTAPIRLPGQTVEALRPALDALVRGRGARADRALTVCGNQVRLRRRAAPPILGTRFVLLVHNASVDAVQLLDDACAHAAG